MLSYKINKELLLKNKATREIEKTKQKLEQYKKYLAGKEVDEVATLYFAFNKGWIDPSNKSNIYIPPLK